MRPLRVALAGLLCAGLAIAPAAAARQRAVAASLLAPRAGAVLAGGAEAELEWAPLGGELPPAVEEWEAFLSVDGGRSYPFRVTPHLDHDLRRVRFRVPNVATGDARLLLRFGDERRETPVELPQRFAIATTPGAGLELGETVFARGEAPLPGRPGVVAWVEGSRRGAGLRAVVAAAPPALAQDLSWPEEAPAAATAAEAAPETAPAAPGPSSAALPAPGPRPAAAGPGRSVRPFVVDLLLQTRRRNE